MEQNTKSVICLVQPVSPKGILYVNIHKRITEEIMLTRTRTRKRTCGADAGANTYSGTKDIIKVNLLKTVFRKH